MIKRDSKVGSTADGLVVIRSGELARTLGIKDPFAHWFVTNEGHSLVELAKSTDPVYEEFNLSRFKYTTSRLEALATSYKQVILLGAGFDCRALWLNQFQTGRVKIFEVDTSEKLEQKLQILNQHDYVLPDWDCYIRVDLRTDDVFQSLVSAGFDPDIPVLTLAEGLTYFIPPETSQNLTNHRTLRLATGSRLIFDCWTTSRVERLNHRVKERLGFELFHSFPFSVEPTTLAKTLMALGYSQSTITPLAEIAAKHWKRSIQDDFGLSWYLVEVLL